MPIDNRTLIKTLIENGSLSQEEGSSVLAEAEKGNQSVENILLNNGKISEDAVWKAKADSMGLPFYKVGEKKIDHNVLALIPEEAANNYHLVPLDLSENVLTVGMVNVEDIRAIEALNFLTARSSFKVRTVIITPTDFGNVYLQYKSLKGEVEEALSELEGELEETPGKTEESAVSEAEAPITKIVAVILKHAVDGKASDIHIEPVEHQVQVRFRLDGILYTSLLLPKDVHASVVSRIKIVAKLKIDETRIPQDGRFRATINNIKIDFRVSTFPTVYGEKVVMRVLDPTIGLKDFEGLGMRGRNLRIFREYLKRPYKMILLTGPTGSGKSTTLYAALKDLNKEGVNIVTLEDPVEYYIDGINQSQMRPEIGYSFADGLRHLVRQDPDIVMVGEIRDNETAELAVHSALTGHLVLSTLHTNNAVGVVPRLIDMKIDAFLLPASLMLMISQRLVPRICQDCKEAHDPNPAALKIIQRELAKNMMREAGMRQSSYQ